MSVFSSLFISLLPHKINETNQNIALSKADFVRYIYNDIPPFQNFDFESFIKIFDVIARIVQTGPAKSFSDQQEDQLKKLAKKHSVDVVGDMGSCEGRNPSSPIYGNMTT